MTKKSDTVELEANGKKREFELSHAEKIMRMPNNGGWHLPDGSAYNLDATNAINRRASKREPKKPEQESNDRKSD
tara:strand:+ start:63 stop:287 length:225 start_codon:yes stop_codon:yes gene_type:complete